ncbi:hypothetical protein LZD79_04155 [Lactobacillus mulieris]|uniref:hypothetical protein n=1 Tax=Lactobacillus TaxID=1578 RepID=UPI001197278E|nr:MULTISPECIES: hypothetical protein [Lactobacillus]MCF1797302.1 hypothetical protein [Lactobacillus mulieris]MDK7308820.1 hypothetical protein [Lactobacillus jensenii]TVV22608.1 hypothetical protein FOF69_00615 [Lactobacillus jensenii]
MNWKDKLNYRLKYGSNVKLEVFRKNLRELSSYDLEILDLHFESKKRNIAFIKQVFWAISTVLTLAFFTGLISFIKDMISKYPNSFNSVINLSVALVICFLLLVVFILSFVQILLNKTYNHLSLIKKEIGKREENDKNEQTTE